MIVERQDIEGWGKAVVEQLAADLRTEFPGVGGFSASNLWRMKAFFEAYTGLEKLAPTGARNRLEPQPGHPGALQGPAESGNSICA